MRVAYIKLRLIESSLKRPFVTHLETVRKRRAIIVEAGDGDGRRGFGEADPFSSPWYTEETITTCWHVLRDFLIPLTLEKEIHDPGELDRIWSGVRGNHMAKSGLSQALCDLYARQKGVYIGRLFASVRKQVAAGAVIAASNPQKAVEQIRQSAEAGYRRYKIKVSRRTDTFLLSEIRKAFPSAALMADANASYSLADLEHVMKLDAFHLQMIEQPLACDDLVDHAVLQSRIRTPICLDESIRSFADTRAALALGSCRIINIKMARVGGWSAAVRIHDLCREHHIPVWCGGMIEFGVARAHSIALASLPGFTFPGDLFASSHYWQEDIIQPDIAVRDGYIRVPDRPGIGVEINWNVLEKLTLRQLTVYDSK